MESSPFAVLVSKPLSSVIFVQDYLQLDFNGYILTLYNWPKIIVSNTQFSIGDSEYRNILCALINDEINAVKFVENDSLKIFFNSKKEIAIFFANAEGEVIYFTTPEGEWSSV